MRKKIIKIIVASIIVIIAQNIGRASVIAYIPYHAKTDVVTFKTTDQFVICDNCKPQTIIYANYKNTQQFSILHAMLNSAGKSILRRIKKSFGQLPAPVILRKNQVVSINNKPANSQTRLNIYFPFDSYQINRAGKKLLDEFAKTSKEATVEGFTDCTGSHQYNDILAKKRAESVASYLRKKGVKVLVKTSYGKYLTEKSDKASRRAIVTKN